MRRNKAQGFGDAFKDFLKQEDLDGKWDEGLLWAKWHEVVGGALARETRKMTVKRGVLVVYATSAAARHQFTLESPVILQKANGVLRTSVLKALEVRE